MPVDLWELAEGKVFVVKIMGKLTKDDYHEFVPELEKQIKENGKIRLVCKTEDFDGWTAGAAWEDMKFDFKHYSDIERLAIVGESKWAKTMAVFCKPFTRAEIKYFHPEETQAADDWVMEGLE